MALLPGFKLLQKYSQVMSSKLIGAIDQGTSSTKFMLFDSSTWDCLSFHQKQIRSHSPQEGWSEQDPSEILESVLYCMRKAEKDLPCAKIEAIGISNQRETVLAWERGTGLALSNAIVWNDLRTSSLIDEYIGGHGADVLKDICGLPLSPYFTAGKIKWLIDNVPAVRESLEKGNCCFGTIDSWLLWNMTRGSSYKTDVTNASRTMLFNLTTLDWDDRLLSFFSLPSSRDWLPEICPSASNFGEITGHGFPFSGTPITAMVGDQQAALFGHQCFQKGSAKNTYGTGCFMLKNIGNKPSINRSGLITTVAYQIDGDTFYAHEGSVAAAGSAINWLRDNMRLFSDFGEFDDLVGRVQDCGICCFVPAFSGLYSPQWDSSARGLMCGLTQYTHSGHICLAALEAIAFQNKLVFDSEWGDGILQLRVDGGLSINNKLMQMQADILNVPLSRFEFSEFSAFGAALAAATFVGLFSVGIPVEPFRFTTFSPTLNPYSLGCLICSQRQISTLAQGC